MSQRAEALERELAELRGMRDGLRLRAHLAGTEARDLWDDLGERFAAVETRANRLVNASEGTFDDLSKALGRTMAELRRGYARLRERVDAAVFAETVWDPLHQSFDWLIDEGDRATEHAVDTIPGLGEAARLRAERIRLERDLLKECAKLGTRVFELARRPASSDGPPLHPLDDDVVKTLLREVGSLDARMREVRSEIAGRAPRRDDS